MSEAYDGPRHVAAERIIPDPSPAVADTQRLHAICQTVEANLPDVTDLDLLNSWNAQLAAIDAYLRQTSTAGRAQIGATMVRLGQRIGQLLGEPVQGRPAAAETSPAVTFPRMTRSRARAAATHPEIAESVIAETTDASPASLRKVAARVVEQRSNRFEESWREAVARLPFLAAVPPAFRKPVLAGVAELNRLSGAAYDRRLAALTAYVERKVGPSDPAAVARARQRARTRGALEQLRTHLAAIPGLIATPGLEDELSDADWLLLRDARAAISSLPR